jgi:hypothetical protein
MCMYHKLHIMVCIIYIYIVHIGLYLYVIQANVCIVHIAKLWLLHISYYIVCIECINMYWMYWSVLYILHIFG